MTAARTLHPSVFRSPRLWRYLTPASRLVPLLAPCGLGQPRGGVEDGPGALLHAGLLEGLARVGWQLGDDELASAMTALPPVFPSSVSLRPPAKSEVSPHTFHNASALARVLEDVSRRATRHAWLRDFVLTLGGDHSVACGSIHGVATAWSHLGVIWVDAHADFNTPASSPSGNFHGMPLAALCGAFSLKNSPGFAWFEPCLRSPDIVLVGARALDAEEARLLAAHGIACFPAEEVARRGMDAVIADAIDWLLAGGERPLHLSFDIDALDSTLVPGTGTPEPNGLTLEDGETLCRALRETGLLVGMDLVEVNPRLETPERFEERQGSRTIACALALLRATLDQGPASS